MVNEKLLIIGQDYHLFVKPYDDPELSERNADGFTDFWDKRIVLSDLGDWSEEHEQSSKSIYAKQIMRHEIIHAFLFESGMSYNSGKTEHWAANEEMVDWIAIQSPKLFKLFQEAGCL